IAGTVGLSRDAQANATILRRMCAVMSHRGPDDDGIYTEGRVGIGMRRLSIVDLATGHQPLANEDDSLWIVFNGEIYNHAALRESLISAGHAYRTRSDTETILHLYEQYGKDSVKHLRGMFAFALWDRKRKSLFIARDRLGIKPLYYTKTANEFVFGSEIKVLLAHPDTRAELNRTAIPEYLAFGYLSGDETLYRGVRKLMPGHWLEFNEAGEIQIEQYWDIESRVDEPAKAESYYVNSYRELLEGAV